jgi:hypothetical protein
MYRGVGYAGDLQCVRYAVSYAATVLFRVAASQEGYFVRQMHRGCGTNHLRRKVIII